MYWPVGSNRAAKTSPEWPVSSMTGDCSALLREPYVSCQHIAASAIVFPSILYMVTYPSYECAILTLPIHDCDC